MSDEPRAAVLILCRLSAGDARRLGNVLEIGVSSLILEIDDPPEPAELVKISFVVPGTGRRVELDGVVDQQGPVGCLVKIASALDPALADFIRRRIAAGEIDGPLT